MKRAGAKRQVRLSADDRKQKIAEAAMILFAHKGFHGTTTRELARAASVSEALLFKYFKDKDAIYEHVQFLCLEAEQVAGETLGQRPPSTESLIMSVSILVYEVFFGFGGRAKCEMLRRLQTHSLLEDGKFIRAFFKRHLLHWFPYVKQCFAAARKSGDLVNSDIPDISCIWFVHHLPMMVRLTRLAPVSVQYGSSERELLDQLIHFCLRGIGLTETAIKRAGLPDFLPR
ncbi:MAG: TetR/AcrR family transcriptional regulator [Leptospirales bacterium]|nr:TetR/AcrR family transcriptional regulator [Leptospirales bacterium]